MSQNVPCFGVVAFYEILLKPCDERRTSRPHDPLHFAILCQMWTRDGQPFTSLRLLSLVTHFTASVLPRMVNRYRVRVLLLPGGDFVAAHYTVGALGWDAVVWRYSRDAQTGRPKFMPGGFTTVELADDCR